jgi:manganese/zinc/iron transport system permease protein
VTWHAALQQLSVADKVTLGSALLGAMAGAVGCLSLLRRRALVGDMLAHAALPGVCLAFLVTGSRGLAVLSCGALLSGMAAVGAMTLATRWTRTREDAALGIVLSTWFGLGVVLWSGIARSPRGGSSAGLDAYLLGEPANMLGSDLIVLIVVGAVLLAAMTLLFKEFQVTTFDQGFAHSQGWPVFALDYGMMSAVAIVTIVGLPIVGAMLMAALLILPAATARMWTNRWGATLLLAAACGAAAGALGTRWGASLPAGPAIVLAAAALFAVSALCAPQRGAAARLLAYLRLRARVGQDHVLRSLYELSEPQLPQSRPVPFAELLGDRHWRPATLRWMLRLAQRRGLLYWGTAGVALTGSGWRQAAEAVKTHRLWELYMIGYAGSASDHVDRSADDVEHLLPPALRAALERELQLQGRLPAAPHEVPASPHPISGDRL